MPLLILHRIGEAVTVGLDTGFFWHSSIYPDYSRDSGFIRNGRSERLHPHLEQELLTFTRSVTSKRVTGHSHGPGHIPYHGRPEFPDGHETY